VVMKGGRMCGCGHAGHLEAYAGRAALEREARARAAAGPTNMLVQLAGDEIVRLEIEMRKIGHDRQHARWREAERLEFLPVELRVAERQIDGRATLLAGSIFFSFGSTISYAFSGWGRKSHALRANDLIHAEMIEAARRAGYRSYDFGEVAGGQQSLAAFKGKWGAQARRLYHVVYPARVDAQESGLGSGRLHGVAASLWRRMPLEVTAALGDLVYRFL